MPNLTNAAQIGEVYFNGWHGRLSVPQTQLDEYARIGVTGSGSQIVGTRGAKVVVSAWAGAASNVEAIRFCETVQALQGTVQRVVDDFATEYLRVRISSAVTTCRVGKGPTLGTGQQMTHLIEATFSMEVLP